jgi:hypothetical protein
MTIIALINFGSTFRKRMQAQAQEQEQATAQAATNLLSEPELEPQPQPRKPPQLQPSGSEGHDNNSGNSNVAPTLEVEEQGTLQALRHIPKASKEIGQQKRGGGGGDVTSGHPVAASGSLPSVASPSMMLPGSGRGQGEGRKEEQAQNEFGFKDFGGGAGLNDNSSRGNMGSSTNGYDVTFVGGDYVTSTGEDVTPAKDGGRLGVTSREYIVTPTGTGDANVTLARISDVTPKERMEVNVTLAEQADVTSTSYLYYTQLSEGNIEGNIVPALAEPEPEPGHGYRAGAGEEVTVTDFDLEPTVEGLRTALVMLCNHYTAWGVEDPLLTVVRNALYGSVTENETETDYKRNQSSQAVLVSEPEQIELELVPAPEVIEPELNMEVAEVPEVKNPSPSASPTEFNVTLTPTPTPTLMLPVPTEQDLALDLGVAADADDTTEGNKELKPLSEVEAETEAEVDVTLAVALLTSEGNISHDDSSSTSVGSESSVGTADGADEASDADRELDVTPDVDDGSSSSNSGSSARQFVLTLLARPENKAGLASNVLSKCCIEQFNVTPKYLRRLLSTMKSEGLIAQHGRGQPYFLAEAEAEADTLRSATPASEMATITTAEPAEAEVGG